MNKLIIMRGLPGSGKSKVVREIIAKAINDHQHSAIVCSADQFFTNPDGEYNFNPSMIAQAHMDCQVKALKANGCN